MEQPLLTPAPGYDELWRQVDFATMDIPERFNLGVACVDGRTRLRGRSRSSRWTGPHATTRSAR